MSRKSNDQGRAFEYICLITLYKEISTIRPVTIIKNSSIEAAQQAWNLTEKAMQKSLKFGAEAIVPSIFELEPLIVEDGKDKLELMLQPDSQGKVADVRDLLIIRRNIQWEIGLSIKHNHKAVKHSRLSSQIDFGEKWYGMPCSSYYWDSVTPIFSYLDKAKQEQKLWRDVPDKTNKIYVPLLESFVNEIKRAYDIDKQIPKKLVEYLLGKFDFYKVISEDCDRLTQIQTYNIRGTLNKASKVKTSSIKVPIVALPTRIISIEMNPRKKTTVELYLDKGWQFSFRIHNAEKKVIPSLKFDVQIDGAPTTIISINCCWKEKD